MRNSCCRKFVGICFCLIIVVASLRIVNGENNEEKRVETTHRIDSINLLFFVGLLIVTILTIWFFKHYRVRFVHETGLAIIYGGIVGLIIRYGLDAEKKTYILDCLYSNKSGSGEMTSLPSSVVIHYNNSQYYEYTHAKSVNSSNVGQPQFESKATFDPEIFFNIILPPIIFNAGYQMKRKQFFRNFGAIVTFAFLGTTISTFTIGGLMYGFTHLLYSGLLPFTDCLMFGAIISATDPVTVLAIFNDLYVDMDLYALVFGESVLNDAVAIVLVQSISKYSTGPDSSELNFVGILRSFGEFVLVFVGAFTLGSVMGCITALITKYTHIRDFPLLETSLFVLMSYATFLAAEAAEFTGIVAVLFCGICQAHYTYNNLSKESQTRTKELCELINFLMENFVFTYIGVSLFTFRNHSWDAGIIFLALLCVVLARAVNIYPLSFLLNLGRSRKIPCNFQHMMMFAGLRGAMAFALAIRDTSSDSRRAILSTTLVIVIVTVILCGGFTTQVLQWFNINVGVEEERELQNFGSMQNYGTSSVTRPENTQNAAAATEQSRLREKARLVRVWYNIDRRIVKPLLTHTQPPLTETLPHCCLPLARLLTTTEQMSSGMTSPDSDRARDVDSECILNDDEIATIDGSRHDVAAAGQSPTMPTPPQAQLVDLLQTDAA